MLYVFLIFYSKLFFLFHSHLIVYPGSLALSKLSLWICSRRDFQCGFHLYFILLFFFFFVVSLFATVYKSHQFVIVAGFGWLTDLAWSLHWLNTTKRVHMWVRERAPASLSHKFISIDLHNVISGGNDRKNFATCEFNSVAVAYEMLNHCFNSHTLPQKLKESTISYKMQARDSDITTKKREEKKIESVTNSMANLMRSHLLNIESMCLHCCTIKSIQLGWEKRKLEYTIHCGLAAASSWFSFCRTIFCQTMKMKILGRDTVAFFLWIICNTIWNKSLIRLQSHNYY